MAFLKSQIAAARKTDLVHYLSSRGETLIKEGSQYRLKGHSGLMIKKNYWYNHSLNIGGNAIDYLIKIENKSFIEAVSLLLNDQFDIYNSIASPNLLIPKRNFNDKKVLAYLIISRKLDPTVVIPLIKIGRIYEAADFHDCIFTGIDNENIIRYIFRRSTLSNSNFKIESKGSDKRFSFSLVGRNDICYVFESAIDLLSYISLFKDSIDKNSNFISLAGTSDIALNHFIANLPNINNIVLCLDNDKIGIQSSRKLLNKYAKKNLFIQNHLPDYKDWNEHLRQFRK